MAFSIPSSDEIFTVPSSEGVPTVARNKLQLARNKKAKRSTTSGTSSAASPVHPPHDVPAPQPQLTAPITQNHDPEQNRPAELPISEDPWWFRMWTPKDARDPDRRDAEPRPRDLPPRDGHHAPEHRDRALQPPVDIGAGVGSLYSPGSTTSREVQAMRDRITQLEAQLTVTPPSPKDSGFQTPREIPVVNNLIDLDIPPRPRIPREKIGAKTRG